MCVEWPLASNAHSASELAELAKAEGGLTLVGLQARVAPVILKIRGLIESDAIGKRRSSRVKANSAKRSRDEFSEGLACYLEKGTGGNSFTI